MTAPVSWRGPKVALAGSRPRSGSKPAYRPLASRLENGAALSSAPIRILPFVWSAYMYVASSTRGRAGVGEGAEVGLGSGDAWGRQAARATTAAANTTIRGVRTSR